LKYVIKWPARIYRVDITVHDELGRLAFIIKRGSWNPLGLIKIWIYDCTGSFIGMMKRLHLYRGMRIKYKMFVGDNYIGEIKEANSFSWPVIRKLDHQGWRVIFESYDRNVKFKRVVDQAGNLIMTITCVRQNNSWLVTDYIEVAYPEHALIAMMIAMS